MGKIKVQFHTKAFLLELLRFFSLKVISTVIIVLLLLCKTKSDIGKDLALSNIIKSTSNPFLIYFLLFLMVLFSSIYTTYRYSINNKAVKEFNELSLYASIVYSAYMLFFISPTSSLIDINSPHFYNSTLIWNIFGQIVAITCFFSKAFIIIVDINEFYKTNNIIEEQEKVAEESTKSKLDIKTSTIIKLSIILAMLSLKKK
jgi:hypothetical protein|uniref:Uncharacterized protein n=1 Tax=Serratia marcescens TaxID=615 RepID=A0A1C3HMG7_SERMA|nr:Uncharacterised protein [Serratia marcescens]